MPWRRWTRRVRHVFKTARPDFQAPQNPKYFQFFVINHVLSWLVFDAVEWYTTQPRSYFLCIRAHFFMSIRAGCSPNQCVVSPGDKKWRSLRSFSISPSTQMRIQKIDYQSYFSFWPRLHLLLTLTLTLYFGIKFTMTFAGICRLLLIDEIPPSKSLPLDFVREKFPRVFAGMSERSFESTKDERMRCLSHWFAYMTISGWEVLK